MLCEPRSASTTYRRCYLKLLQESLARARVASVGLQAESQVVLIRIGPKYCTCDWKHFT